MNSKITQKRPQVNAQLAAVAYAEIDPLLPKHQSGDPDPLFRSHSQGLGGSLQHRDSACPSCITPAAGSGRRFFPNIDNDCIFVIMK